MGGRPLDEVEDALPSRWPETRLEPSLDRIRAFTEVPVTRSAASRSST